MPTISVVIKGLNGQQPCPRPSPASPRFAPAPWVHLGLATMVLARGNRLLTGRHVSLEEEAEFSRRLGKAVGELTGALAYRVAPPRPGTVGFRSSAHCAG